VETGTVVNESPSFETDDPETSGELGSNKAGQHEGDSAICFLSILSRLFYMQRVDDKLRDSLAWCARVDEPMAMSKGNIGQHDLDTPISASRRIAFTRPLGVSRYPSSLTSNLSRRFKVGCARLQRQYCAALISL
jgi:hypothetical protein